MIIWIIIEGQHRYRAIMELREKDAKAKKNYENAMKKWQKNGSRKEDKPEDLRLKLLHR